VARFSANLTMLWPEIDDSYERFRAAAAAGFTHVERLFMHDLDPVRVGELLVELGLELVLFDPYPGDWAAGERGLLGLPGRESETREAVLVAIETARSLGVPRLNVLSGIVPIGVARSEAMATAVRNLEVLAPAAAEAGVSLLVEPINDLDWPGYAVPTVDTALQVVSAVGHQAVALQFDTYHVARAGSDPLKRVDETLSWIRHVQIADHPGRHQPGTGDLELDRFVERLDELGYDGFVGLEYIPEGPMVDALAWLPMGARG